MGSAEQIGSGHYEVLGVAPTASAAEIRAAYLALARQHHPDRLNASGGAGQAASAQRMARINAAWTVLSDRDRRAAYDAGRGAARTGANVRDADATFRPVDDDGDDPVDPRLLDDTPSGAPSLHRVLTFLPAVLAVAGAVVLGFGAFLGFGGLVGLGVLLLVASGAAFLLIPLVALIASSRADRDP